MFFFIFNYIKFEFFDSFSIHSFLILYFIAIHFSVLILLNLFGTGFLIKKSDLPAIQDTLPYFEIMLTISGIAFIFNSLYEKIFFLLIVHALKLLNSWFAKINCNPNRRQTVCDICIPAGSRYCSSFHPKWGNSFIQRSLMFTL